MLDTAETRLFPAVTTAPTADATAVSVPAFKLSLAAVRLEPKPVNAFDRSVI